MPSSSIPRLLLVTRWFLPTQGGAQHHAARLALAWQDLGGESRVVTGRFDPAWPAEERMFGGRLRVTRIASPQRPRGAGTLVYLNALRQFLLRERASYDAILVHFLKYSAMLCGAMRGQLGGAPVIARVEGAGPTGDIGTLRSLWAQRLVRAGIRRIDRLVGISRRTVEEIAAEGFDRSRIALIPNGVDCEQFRPLAAQEDRAALRREFDPAAAPDDLVMICLGRLVPIKALDLLIETLAKWQPAPEDAKGASERRGAAPLSWRLWIAGDGPERAHFESLARVGGLAERVKFLGHVEASERLLRAADVFLQPSREEGLSLALLEAMASGLGVVATRVSGSEDHISPGETGLLTEPGDAAGLRAAIGNLLGDAPLRRRMGEAARRHVLAECAMPVVARRYAELFLEIPVHKTR